MDLLPADLFCTKGPPLQKTVSRSSTPPRPLPEAPPQAVCPFQKVRIVRYVRGKRIHSLLPTSAMSVLLPCIPAGGRQNIFNTNS